MDACVSTNAVKQRNKKCPTVPASVQPIKRRVRPAVPIPLESFVKAPKTSEEDVKAELGF